MVRTVPAALALPVVSALVVWLSCFRSGPPPIGQPDDVPPIEVPAEDLKALVEGNNQFAIDLYKQVAAKQDGNLILSPLELSVSFVSTANGSIISPFAG
jgi:hypothetical protein